MIENQLGTIGLGWLKPLGKGAATLLFALHTTLVFAASEGGSFPEGVASVNGFPISMEDFDFEYREEARRRFYHSKPADEQLQAFRLEIRDSLIDSILLVNEAKRLGLAPSQLELDKEMSRLQAGVKVKAGVLQGNELYWNLVRLRFQRQRCEESLREWLYGQVQVSEEETKGYYDRNPDKFTEPERYRVSVILLGVDPSSDMTVWQRAEQDASALVFRLHNGADFSELAQAHSHDITAAKGGDMGYQHAGMLAPAVNKALAEMDLNAIADPIRVLEGYSIFKLTEKIAIKHRRYQEVADRAGQLSLQEAREQAWETLLEKLRSQAVIVINMSL